MLNEFIAYLKAQVGEPYLWGGQHTKLTPENYVSTIHKKEDGRGGYSGGPTYAQAVIDFCKKKFAAGASVLYAYDCSGLGCYWLYNLMHLYKGDVNANTMMNRCNIVSTPPKRGYWVFKLSGSRATHIGYMISDTELIEAKGRKYGVVKTAFKKADWARWGIPKVFESEIIDPPAPPAPPVVGKTVKVVGGSVWVRDAGSTAGRKLFVVHKGDKGEYIDTAPSGWYHVRFPKGEGYITNLEKYTRLEG